MINWLNNLKLTLTQWLLVSGAALVGSLVVALKLQGSRMHGLQVQLLQANFKAQDKTDDDAVLTARKSYAQALQEYNRNQP